MKCDTSLSLLTTRISSFSSHSKDVLVRYDELREQNEGIRRRAYFLSQNLDRISRHKRPRFVDPRNISIFNSLPVINSGSVDSDSRATGPLAYYYKDHKEFSLTGMSGLDGTYELPVYRENNGNAARMALTPLAVGGDILIVSLVTGFVAAYAYASAGGCLHR